MKRILGYLGLVLGSAILWLGLASWLPAFTEGSVTIDTPHRSVSHEADVDGLHTLNFAVRNTTGTPVRLIGYKPTCECTTIADLPLTIAANETRNICLTLDLKGGKPGKIKMMVPLYFDRDLPESLSLTLACEITEAHRSHSRDGE
jgi:hypothetical protein